MSDREKMSAARHDRPALEPLKPDIEEESPVEGRAHRSLTARDRAALQRRLSVMWREAERETALAEDDDGGDWLLKALI